MTERTPGRLSYAHSPAGVPIAEIELAPREIGEPRELADAAAGARLLCVYSTADLADAGFQRREGCRQGLAGGWLPGRGAQAGSSRSQNQLYSVAGRSSMLPGMALTWDDSRWTSANVAWCLCMLAHLAPSFCPP